MKYVLTLGIGQGTNTHCPQHIAIMLFTQPLPPHLHFFHTRGSVAKTEMSTNNI